MKYNSQHRKLDLITNKTVSEEINAENLTKYRILEKPEHFGKVPIIVPLITNYNFTFGIVDTPFDERIIILEGGPNMVGYTGPIPYTGYFNPMTMRFLVTFTTVHEDLILASKLIPKISIPSGYNFDDYDTTKLFATCKHAWNQIDDKTWQMYCEILSTVQETDGWVPTYLSLDLIFFNERVLEENNPTKQ